MKRLFFALTIVVFLLSGCAKPHQPYPQEVDMHRMTEASKNICYQSNATLQAARSAVIQSVPESQRMMVAMIYLQQQANAEIVAAATGNSIDPCRSTNMFDMEIAEVKANAALNGKWIDAAKWGIGLGATAFIAHDMFSALEGAGGVSYILSDNAKLNTNSQNSGSYNQVGGDLLNEGDNMPVNNNMDGYDRDKVEGLVPPGYEPVPMPNQKSFNISD